MFIFYLFMKYIIIKLKKPFGVIDMANIVKFKFENGDYYEGAK